MPGKEAEKQAPILSPNRTPASCRYRTARAAKSDSWAVRLASSLPREVVMGEIRVPINPSPKVSSGARS